MKGEEQKITEHDQLNDFMKTAGVCQLHMTRTIHRNLIGSV